MAGLVDIVLPSGEQATVPEADLSQAVEAGAHVPTADEARAQEAGGLLARGATFGIGAARTASMGFSDAAVSEMANIVGGESARKDMLRSIDIARNANQYSNMAGEFAGLFVGGTASVGEAAEQGVTAKLGEGLAGKVGSMAVRGGVEGSLLGFQHEVTEATLGDHDLNGEKVFASVGKDALLGAGLGAALGLGAHGLSTAIQKVRGARGPISAGTLDEIAGVEGAGTALKEEAAEAQKLVDGLQRSGATSEQAAKIADEVMTMTRAKANSGPLSGLMDNAATQYIARRAGANTTMGETIAEAYASRAQKLADRAEVLDTHALSLKKVGDRVMRAEDALNEVQFQYKADHMAKLVDPARFGAQRDQLASLLQHTDDSLRFWETTASKGGAEGAIKSLRKMHTDALDALYKVEETGGVAASKDFFVKADKFKRSIDSLSSYGKSSYGLPEAVMHPEAGLRGIGDKWRAALEDEAVWGNAAAAQKEWNATFSNGFSRRQDFGNRFAVGIDQARGVPISEMDAGKVKDALLKKLGSEADAQQALKSTESWVNGNRDRINAIRKYGDLSEKQLAALEDGHSAIGEFEKLLGTAKKESEVIARIEKLQLEEQGKDIGGLLGFGADLITKPLTTMERLGAVRAMTRKTEEAIAGGMERFFGKRGAELVEDLKLRPKADVAKEIGDIKATASNASALEARAQAMVGDMSQHAPKTAQSAMATAKRALLFLAKEAPKPSVSVGIMSMSKPEPRYSDHQIRSFETKRRAALDPVSVVTDMKHGKLNRDAIRTVEFVSPKLYAEMQRSAQDWITKQAAEGKLDAMPYAQKAQLATLLKVPADGTWQPDFILMMQAAKAQPAPQQQQGPAQGAVTSKRAVKINSGAWETKAYQIEKR